MRALPTYSNVYIREHHAMLIIIYIYKYIILNILCVYVYTLYTQYYNTSAYNSIDLAKLVYATYYFCSVRILLWFVFINCVCFLRFSGRYNRDESQQQREQKWVVKDLSTKIHTQKTYYKYTCICMAVYIICYAPLNNSTSSLHCASWYYYIVHLYVYERTFKIQN